MFEPNDGAALVAMLHPMTTAERDRAAVVTAEKEADRLAFIERTKVVNTARHAEEAARQTRLDAEKAEFDAKMATIRATREAAEADDKVRIASDMVAAIRALQTRIENLERRLQIRA